MDPLPRSPSSRPRTRLLAIGSSLALMASVVAASGAAAAGNVYTGCLDDGDMFNVAIGPSPLASCQGTSLISWNQQGAKGARGAKGAKGKRGAKGEQGEAGAKGEPGSKGAPGADVELRTYTVTSETVGAGGQLLQVAAECDTGDLATGGGFETDGLILASLGFGEPSPTGWQAIAEANEDATGLTASAICADLPPFR